MVATVYVGMGKHIGTLLGASNKKCMVPGEQKKVHGSGGAINKKYMAPGEQASTDERS